MNSRGIYHHGALRSLEKITTSYIMRELVERIVDFHSSITNFFSFYSIRRSRDLKTQVDPRRISLKPKKSHHLSNPTGFPRRIQRQQHTPRTN
jgi:hypothetical protein